MKIGFLLNKGKISIFYYNLIQAISIKSGFEIHFIVIDKNPFTEKKQSLWYSYLLFSLYLKFERIITRIKNYPLNYVDLPTGENFKIISVENIGKGIYTNIAPDDIEKLKNEKFDLFFRIGWGIIKGEILNIAKNGIWSLHHGDNDYFRGKPALFWEYYYNKQIAGVILQKLNSTLDGGIIQDKLYTNLNPFYITKGYYTVYYKSLQMVIENITSLQENGLLVKNTLQTSHVIYDQPLYKTPNIWQQFKLIFHLLFKNCKRKLNVKKPTWYIFLNKSLKKELLYKYKKINNTKGHFSADPFLFEKDNKTFVFYEEASLKSSLGHISYFNIELPEVKHICLKENFHLSFPNIFENKGQIYMLPETRQNETITLYECIEFPMKWKFYKHLLQNISACDSDIFYHEGMYYLFSCINKNDYLVDTSNLNIYYCNTIDGEYKPHPQNPIMRDDRYARMAGKIHFTNGKIYRFSQNQSLGYGSTINVHEIEILTANVFREKLLQTMSPKIFHAKGMHTFNAISNSAVIDVYK